MQRLRRCFRVPRTLTKPFCHLRESYEPGGIADPPKHQAHNKLLQTDERRVLVMAELQMTLALLAAERQNRSADDLVACSRRREPVHFGRMSYQDIITIEPDKRGGKPCIRGMRITVYDVLEYLASGMTQEQILEDFPELTAADIRACLEFAADRERKLVSIPPE